MLDNILTSMYDSYKQFYIPDNKRSDSKKENQNVINSMSKINAKSPLYITSSEKSQKENLKNIKENANELYYRINQATGKNSGFNSILDKKIPQSSNEELLDVSFINKEIDTENIPEYEIKVNNLSQKQINIGTFLSNSHVNLKSGIHQFNIKIDKSEYQFQFSTGEKETNLQMQERLQRLINKSNINISADIIDNGFGQTAIKISEKEKNPRNLDENGLKFVFSDEPNDNVVKYLGLDNINNKPELAKITINGQEKAFSSNKFEIDNTYVISLNNISKSEKDVSVVNVADDASAIIEGAEEVVYGLNKFIGNINKGLDFAGNRKIKHEINSLTKQFNQSLNEIGIKANEEGMLFINKEDFKEGLKEGKDFTALKTFADSLLEKANDISINPIEYIDKKIAAYKNPNKIQLEGPYTSSKYSGMFLDKMA